MWFKGLLADGAARSDSSGKLLAKAVEAQKAQEEEEVRAPAPGCRVGTTFGTRKSESPGGAKGAAGGRGASQSAVGAEKHREPRNASSRCWELQGVLGWPGSRSMIGRGIDEDGMGCGGACIDR
jgi:hypothetical protein